MSRVLFWLFVMPAIACITITVLVNLNSEKVQPQQEKPRVAQDFATIFKQADYVVELNIYLKSPPDSEERFIGSGFVFKEKNDGKESFYIMTANHLIDIPYEITKIIANFKCGCDSQEIEAVGGDILTDSALLKFKNPDYQFKCNTAVLGDSDELMPGEPVMAIGSPFLMSYAVTVGVVSKILDNPIDYGLFQPSFIMHTAFVNPGNSGGPVINKYGEVIGINTIMFNNNWNNLLSTSFAGAIPINDAKSLLKEIKPAQSEPVQPEKEAEKLEK